MLMRLLQSVLVGLGTCFVTALLVLIGLIAWLHFVFQPRHPGIGAVAGGIYPALWAALPAFLLGFCWNLFLTRRRS